MFLTKNISYNVHDKWKLLISRIEPTHTGLTILDPLPKKKKNTLKVTKLTSCMNFRMIQAVIKCFERSIVERIEETDSNDLSRCLVIRMIM